MADYKTPQWLLPNEKNLAYPATGDGITGSGLSEDRHSLYSMDFDGTTNQNINLPTNWVTSLGLSTEMSFSVWVKPDSTSTQMNITSSPYNTWNDNFGIKYIAGSTTLTLEQGSTVKFTNTSTTLSTTSYTHICFVLDAGESSASTKVKCYINGTVVTNENTTSSFTTMLDRSYNFYIGRLYYGAGSSNYTWNGQIDEVAIWNKALNQSEINALSVADAPANIMALNEKPIAYYPLGEQAQMGSANWSFPNGSLQSHVVDFDGSGDKIDFSSSIDLGTINTTSLWVRNEVSQDRTLLGEDSYGSDYYILGGYNNFILRIGSSFMVFTTGSTPIIPINSNWTHLAFVRNGDTVTCYINGSSIGSSSTWTGGSPGSTTTKFDTIGAKATGSTSWLGKMSNVAVWNSDQSTNIDNIYNNGSPQSTYTATPTAWWKLNAANSSYVYPWSLELNGDPNVSGGGDHAKVVSNALEIRDIDSSGASTGTGGKVDFLTKEITGAYSGIDVTGEFVINTASSYTNGATLYYKIDGGSWVQFQQQLDTSGSATYAISGASGLTSTTSFQVKIEFETGNSGSSTVTLNNISIGGLYTEDFTNQDGAGWDNDTYTPPPVDWTFIDTETPAPNYTSALNFDGLNDYIDLGGDSSLFPTTAITVSVWVKASTQGNFKYILAAPNTVSYPAYGFQVKTSGASQYVQFVLNTGTAIISPFADVLDNNWHHIAATYNGSSLKMFVDGSEVGTGTSTSGSIIYGPGSGTGAGKLLMGDFGSSSLFFTGSLSNCSIYSSALSAAQVQTLYNSGTPETAISSSPISWWKLDNTTTGIQDSGSASNNGTNNGATQIATNVLISNNGESDTLPTSALTPSDLQFESPYSNYSLSFDGTDDYVDLGNLSSIGISNASAASVSMWFKKDGNGNYILFELKEGTSRVAIQSYLSNSLYIYINGVSYNVATTVANNEWHNIILAFDGTGASNADRLKLYFNGSNITGGTYSGTVPTAVGAFTSSMTSNLGRTPTTAYFDGKIDETAIWSSALTQAQVIQVYNNGYPAALTSLSPVSWWRLGEDAYFVSNVVTIPNKITGGPSGTGGGGDQSAFLVGDAPGSYANGSGTNLAVEDRIGDAPESTANSVSINMIPSNRHSYPAGYVPTQVDNAFSMAFDGVSNSKFNVNPPTIGSDNTISAWAKRVGTGNMFLLGNTSSGGYGCYFVGTSGVYVQGSGGYFAFTNSAVTTAMVRTDWVNWVFIKNSSAGTVSVYVDGELAQSASSTGGMDSLTSIGGSGLPTGSQFPWNGNIDEVAVFNYILSERQIKQDIYNGTTTGKTADLNNISNLTAPVAWYRMGD